MMKMWVPQVVGPPTAAFAAAFCWSMYSSYGGVALLVAAIGTTFTLIISLIVAVRFWRLPKPEALPTGWPDPPENVRIVKPDGTEVPVDCAYLGDGPRGEHVWGVVTGAPLEPGGRVRIDSVPDNTAIIMQAVAESIICPKCGRTSHNPNDVRHRYCGNCHQFHAQMEL